MKPILAAMTVVALAAAPCGAHAQSAADAAKGHQYAQQICSECHTVEADALTESIRICGHIRSKLGQNAGVGLFRCDEGSGIHWDSTSIHLFLAAPAT